MHRIVLCGFFVFCVSWSSTGGMSQRKDRYDESISCPEIKLPIDLVANHNASVQYAKDGLTFREMIHLDLYGERRYVNGTQAFLCCLTGGCYFYLSDNGPNTALCMEGKWTRQFLRWEQCWPVEDNDTEGREKRRLSTAIAERLEGLYDNANSAEKSLLDRVVAQLHDHFET